MIYTTMDKQVFWKDILYAPFLVIFFACVELAGGLQQCCRICWFTSILTLPATEVCFSKSKCGWWHTTWVLKFLIVSEILHLHFVKFTYCISLINFRYSTSCCLHGTSFTSLLHLLGKVEQKLTRPNMWINFCNLLIKWNLNWQS